MTEAEWTQLLADPAAMARYQARQILARPVEPWDCPALRAWALAVVAAAETEEPT